MATIRPATPADARRVRDIYAPAVMESTVSFETDPPSTAEVRERVASTLPDHPWLVCAVDDRVVGYAYAGPHRSRDAYRWSVDVSVYVDADDRRRGVGRGLYASLIACLHRQGFVTAYAGIALPNPASVGLHESLGFERVGVYRRVGYKRGEWRDVGWWGKRLRDPPSDPDPPVPLDALDASDLTEALAAGEPRVDG